MRILITGPSCSGKTTYCRALPGGRGVVELDRDASPGERLSRGNGDLLVEGIPSGSDLEMAALVARMDRVVVLTTPFAVRLQRMLARDGPGGLGRFLFNEFAWRHFVAGLFEGQDHVSWLSEDELPRDPFGEAADGLGPRAGSQ